MQKIDKEYREAIEFYLDRIMSAPETVQDVEGLELHIMKPFENYIKQQAGNDFVFSNPVYGWWDLTSACNFRCVHCLYNDTEYSAHNDLSHEKALELADDLINNGLIEIILTGGEVMLRKDTMDIVRRFKENNVSVKLLTNGSLLTDNHIRELSEIFNIYLDTVQISLDGATDETFRKIRRSDSFEKITENIKKLVHNGIRVCVSCTVNTINYNEIEQIYDLATTLGVQDFMLGKIIYHNPSHAGLMVNNRDLIILTQKILKHKNNKTNLLAGLFTTTEFLSIPEVWQIIEEKKYQDILEKYKKPLSRTCHLHDRIRICSNGDMYMCMEADSCPESKLGNYKENSFEEIWNRHGKNIFFQERPLEKMICKDCKYNVICNGGCIIHSYKKYNDVFAPEYKCIKMSL